MKYSDFIEKLKNYVSTAESLRGSNVTHTDDNFRKWRYEVESLVSEIKNEGYLIPGDFNSSKRAYRAMWSGAKNTEDAEALKKDIGDSLIELHYILDHWANHGEPKKPGDNNKESLTYPNKVTLAWLWTHVSYKWWLASAGVLITVFILGVKVGRTSWWNTIETNILNLF